jgi:hypothetical protein
MLERLYPAEFGRRDRVMVTDWRSEVLTMIRNGSLNYEDVAAELGDEIAAELFERVGTPMAIEDKSGLTIDHDDYEDVDEVVSEDEVDG